MSCDAHHCLTCGDDGVPMRVLRIDAARGLALCEAVAADGPGGAGHAGAEHAGAEHASVETALVEPVAPGDLLLVHAGTALTRLEAGV